MKDKLLGMLTLLAGLILIAHTALSAAEVTISVEGMICSACPQPVKAALERTPGVNRAMVSLGRKEALVDYNESRIQPEGLVELINKLGFRATLQSHGERRK